MKTPRPPSAPRKKPGYKHLVAAISQLTLRLSHRVASVANQGLVLRNWVVGAYIVEFEQAGAERAAYGERLLEKLAMDLAKRGLKGLEVRNLRNCRLLYECYPQIRQTLSAEFIQGMHLPEIRQTVPTELMKGSQMSPTNSSANGPTPLEASLLLDLSWSKFQELIRISDPWKRAFYENECLREKWSVRQLQRQVESLLYERTGLSTNKNAVIERARKQTKTASPESIAELMRDPYILEFTGLAERPEYSENELESALLDHLQRFLLELGNGFCFESRQFRMTEGRKHHRVDLVFYHRLLRCHVLLDLKTRAFKPEDAGQMNYYLNWFKNRMMTEGDMPPVGILLCTDKDGTEVEFATAGLDQTLFVSRYLTALPSVSQLQALVEADRAHFLS